MTERPATKARQASDDPTTLARADGTMTRDDRTTASAAAPTPSSGVGFGTRSTQRTADAAPLNRRVLLRGVLGAAAATVAAGAAFQTQTSRAEAASGIFTASGLGTSAVSATGTNAAYGVNAFSDTEIAVWGRSNTGLGVDGTSQGGIGVNGASTGGGIGVSGNSDSGYAVWGTSTSGIGVRWPLRLGAPV